MVTCQVHVGVLKCTASCVPGVELSQFFRRRVLHVLGVWTCVAYSYAQVMHGLLQALHREHVGVLRMANRVDLPRTCP